MSEEVPHMNEEDLGNMDDGGGGGGEDDPSSSSVPPTPLPLSSKGDLFVWTVIAAMAVGAYLLHLFWRKKGRALWAKVTGAHEVELGLYEINHTSTVSNKTYTLKVEVEDGCFHFVLDPPVIDTFEDKYAEAEEAGHLDDNTDNDGNAESKESARVREELWALLKNRTAVTYELAQVVDEDRPQIQTLYDGNCITDAKFRSFKATVEFMHSQFKEIPEIAEVIKPGSQQTFLRSVVMELQHRSQLAEQRAGLAKLHELKLAPDDNDIIAPPEGIPPGTPLAVFNWSIPAGKEEGDECEFQLPAGMTVVITVPDGKKGGDIYPLKVPRVFMDPEYRTKQEAHMRQRQEIMSQSQGEMGTLKFKVPPGKKPGDSVDVQLPSGLGVKVTIPPGKGPGDVLDLQVPAAALKAGAPPQQQQHGHGHSHGTGAGGHGHSHGGAAPGQQEMVTIPFVVPEGKKEGDECEVPLSSGMGIKVVIPAGKKAGDQLSVQVPKMALQQRAMGEFPFKVPPGKAAGDEVEVRLPSGMAIRVTIPHGKKEGDTVAVRVPADALQAPPMGDFPFKVPEGKAAGDEVEVTLPSSRQIRVKIPDGKKAGDDVTIKLPLQLLNEPPMGDFSFKVPADKESGGEVEVHLPSGRAIRVKIPEDKSAGDEVTIKVPVHILNEPPLGEFVFKIPAGKKAGDVLDVQLPSGRPIRVPVPADKKPGDEIKLQVPKTELLPPAVGEFSFKVPDGKNEGDEVEVTLPSGRPIRIKVPAGKHAGDEANVPVAKSILNEPPVGKIPFRIPAGKQAGDECEIRLPSGQVLRIRVPEGKAAGDTLELIVPKAALQPGGHPGSPSSAGGPVRPGAAGAQQPLFPGVPPGTPMTKLPYRIPQDKKAGDKVDIRLPAGMTIKVEIPGNKGPGDTMELSVPAPFMDPQFQQKRQAALQAQLAQMSPQQRQAFMMQQQMRQHQAFAQMSPQEKHRMLAQMPPPQRQTFLQQHQQVAQAMQQRMQQLQQQQQTSSPSSPSTAAPVSPLAKERAEAARQAAVHQRKAQSAERMASALLGEEGASATDGSKESKKDK